MLLELQPQFFVENINHTWYLYSNN